MRKRGYVIGAIAVLLLTSLLFPARFFFSSNSLSATVIDKQTGQVVEGAILVVIWKQEKPLFHGHDRYILHTVETTTDHKGLFQIEGWGPKYSSFSWTMSGSSPYAYILKRGYEFEVASNYSNGFGGFRCSESKFAHMSSGITQHLRHNIVASWNGCAIPIRQFIQSPDDAAIRLTLIHDQICINTAGAHCSPALHNYFEEEGKWLIELGANRRLLDWMDRRK